MNNAKQILSGILILIFLAVLGSLNIFTISFIITDLLSSSLKNIIAIAGIYILTTVISLKSISALKSYIISIA